MVVRSLLAASAAALFALPAGAADWSTYKPIDFRPAIHDWTGGYAGVHAGHGSGRFSGTFVGWGMPDSGIPYDFFHTGTTKGNGFIVGVHSGYGVQLDTLYFGLEADWTHSQISGSRNWPYTVNIGTLAVPDFHDTALTLKGQADWLATLRARVGVPIDNVLAYATGGVAAGDVHVKGINTSSKRILVGWTAGAGLEAAFDGGWSLRGEYLYYHLGQKGFHLQGILPPPVGGSIQAAGDMGFAGHVIRAGLSYRFD